MTTTTNDERYKAGSRSCMAARSMPSLRWADTGPVAWPRWRGGVWRCTFRRAGGRRAVLSEEVRARALIKEEKKCVFWFRHAACRSPEPAHQHPRKWGSWRRLREIYPRLAGSCLGSAPNSDLPSLPVLQCHLKCMYIAPPTVVASCLRNKRSGLSDRQDHPTRNLDHKKPSFSLAARAKEPAFSQPERFVAIRGVL